MKSSATIRPTVERDRDSAATAVALPAQRDARAATSGRAAAPAARNASGRDDRVTLWMLLLFGLSLVGGGLYAVGNDFPGPLTHTGWEALLTDIAAVAIGAPLFVLAAVQLARRSRSARR